MKMISTEGLNIRELINYAEKENVWLPEFQRPFVWDRNQIRLLIDSLFRNFTISSILIWEGTDELARRRIGGSIKEIKIPEGKEDRVLYLLDGQQRTTSLLLAFTDKPVYKGYNKTKAENVNLWWDSEYDDTNPDLKWLFDDEKIDDPLNPEEQIKLGDLSDDAVFSKYGHRFVKLKHAFKFEDKELNSWFDNELTALRFYKAYKEKLDKLEKGIIDRNVVVIEEKGSLEKVLEVFERINTRNTKLSIFDIMVAKTYRKFPEGFFDLRSYYRIVNFPSGIKPGYFENMARLDLDQVKIYLSDSDLLNLTLIMLNKKFRATEILHLTTQQLMDNIKLLHDKFQEVVDYMRNHFFIEELELKNYQPMMKFLGAAFTEFDRIDLSRQKFLNTWFWNTILKNRYPGSQNEKIERDYLRVNEGQPLRPALEKMLKENTRSFPDLKGHKLENPKFIEAYYNARSQQIYRAMILLLRSKRALDFYSGISPSKSAAISNRLEEHHIFPENSVIGKKIIKERGEEAINNVANISLLTKETNNVRIKAKSPKEYITKFEDEYRAAGKYDDFVKIMESQFITTDMIEMLKNDDFDNFFFARTNEFYKQIETLCAI